MNGLRAADITPGALTPGAHRLGRDAADSALRIFSRTFFGFYSLIQSTLAAHRLGRDAADSALRIFSRTFFLVYALAALAPGAPRCRRNVSEFVLFFCAFFAFFTLNCPAADPWVAEHEPLAAALGRLPGGDPPGLAFEVATTADASRPVTVALVNTAPVARDQALAFAAGAWWAIDADGRSRLTLSPAPPRGRLRADRRPCNLTGDPTAITLVSNALTPWTTRIPGDAIRQGTLSYDEASASWIATLDNSGHNRLLDVLTLLQTPRPQAPALLPDLGLPPVDTVYALAIPSGAWRDWCQQFAAAVAANVSIDPALAATIPPPLTVTGGLREVQAALRAQGIASQCFAGTWCLGSSAQVPAIANREHPAQRSRLALVPIPHLLQEGVTGEALAEALRAAVAPPAWTLPGWTLSWRPTLQALIVIADPPTIHLVLDALDILDRLDPTTPRADLKALFSVKEY